MPIHVRAEPGDYAEAVLLPGDPLRAKYIADTYLDDVKQTNSERGMLGFRGTWEGKDVSVQSTGMGCPSAAIVIEELVMLGCTKLLRVGTCGGLQPHHKLGDMIIALTAVPQDGTVGTYVKEPHCPTADWGLVHGAVHAAKEMGQPVHVGPIVSSDVFYNPDGGQYQRWSDRGILAVEMEAAVLFTIGALKKVHAGCLLTVSDIVVEGEFTRISDEELRAAVDRMTRVALATVTVQSGAGIEQRRPSSSSTRRPATARTGKRWPELAHRAAQLGLEGTTLFSERPGHLIELAEQAARDGAELVVSVGGDGTLNEVVNGLVRAGARDGARDDSARHRNGLRAHVRDPDAVRRCRAHRARGDDEDDRRRPRVVSRVERRGGRALLRECRQRRHERRGRAARERDVEGARRQGDVLLRARPRLLRVGEHASSRYSSTTSAARRACTT